MSNKDKKASASRWPSLMDSAPSSPSAARNTTEPTRVLADLGGHKPARISGGMIAVACGIVAMGIGAGFWATSGPHKAVAKATPATVVAIAPAASSAPTVAPTSSAAVAPEPTAATLAPRKPEPTPAAESSVARITDESRTAPAPQLRPTVQPKAAATPVAVVGKAEKASTSTPSKAEADKPRKVARIKPVQSHASSKQARSSVHAVAPRNKVHAPAKPHGTAIAKGRDDKHRETRAAAPVARNKTDPDTDLLAAMLRRNGGPQ